jgi:regulator of cell morphogenesis and NO signaling
MSIPSQTSTLAELAVSYPTASRIFQRHRLDFCCKGSRSLDAACRDVALDPNNILAEILESEEPTTNWNEASLADLVAHIVNRYHKPATLELSDLISMAQRVEARHGDKPNCPKGLAALLIRWSDELLFHMQKEERVLFPLFLEGHGQNARGPVHVMEAEHSAHGEALTEIRHLTDNFFPPEEACSTWRALYLRLESFERELMEHIALEQEVLFPRGLGLK